MPRLPLIPQEKENYCLCSFLQSVIREEGADISQEDIARSLTESTYGHIVDDDKINDLLRKRGFDYTFYWHNETPFNEPDSVLVEIAENRGFVALGKHIYRVLNFEYPVIKVDDPKDGKTKEFILQELMQELKRLTGGFGLLKRLEEK